MKRLLLLIALLRPFAGVAQTVSLGLKAGIPVTEALETANFDSGPADIFRTQINYTSRAKRYTVGPAVEVSLPFGLALEFDALYKRLDYNFSSKMRAASFGTFNQQQHNIVSRWDLPLLLKYRVRTFAYRTPYISAGLNTNYIVNTTQLSRTFFTPSPGAPVTPPVKLRNPPAELKPKLSDFRLARDWRLRDGRCESVWSRAECFRCHAAAEQGDCETSQRGRTSAKGSFARSKQHLS